MLLLEINVDQLPPGCAPLTWGQSWLLTFPLADDVPHFGGRGSVGEDGGANWKVICSETQTDAAAAAAATSGV